MAEQELTTAANLVEGNRFNLREAFLLRQEQLLATLGVGRGVGTHPVAVGDDSELNWRGVLTAILPTRYQVSKGFAVDADGACSDQIDLLIYDRHFSPVLLDVGEYLYIPAESVYAAIEVKQEFSRGTIEYASKKVASVRRLRRTSAAVPHVGGEAEPKPLHRILGGLLAMQSSWTPPLGGSLDEVLRDVAGDHTSIDVGCALREGSFDAPDDGGPSLRSDGQTALIFFILRLLERLRPMATVPAIEWDVYATVLGEAGRP